MKLTAVQELLFSRKKKISIKNHWPELIFITLLPPLVGFWFNPTDPFFLQASFPILLLPPFLLSLRYGLISGMLSLAIIFLSLTFAYISQIGHMEQYPSQLIFGILVITLVTGEMANNSLTEIRRCQVEKEFLTLRFGEFTNAYHVMKVSHDQLKEQVANAKFSLREALQMVTEELRGQTKAGKRGLNNQVASELLAIFNYFCATQIAGVFRVDEMGKIAQTPEASQGNIGQLNSKDSLVLQALKKGTMVSVRSEMYTSKNKEELETDLLAVVPIRDISGRIWGLVVVTEMHFTAFQEENLNLMQLLGSYTGDLLSQADNILYEEGGREAFIGELKTSWRMAREFGIISSIICITFRKNIPADDYLRAVSSRIRCLDSAWLFSDDKKYPVICLLMPLTTESEYLSYKHSLDTSLLDQFGHTVEENQGTFHHLEIHGKRRFFDIVSFITDRTKDSYLPNLPPSITPVQKTTVALSELQREMDSIRLISDLDQLELISLSREEQQVSSGELDLPELQWLLKAIIYKLPKDFGQKDQLWSETVIEKIVSDKFQGNLCPVTTARMLTQMGFLPKNELCAAIKKKPQLLPDWRVNVLLPIFSQASHSSAVLFFIDESPLDQTFMKNLEKRDIPVRNQRGENPLFMYSAVNTQGDHYYMISEKETNPNDFSLFLQRLHSQLKVPLYLVFGQYPLYTDPQVLKYIESTTGKIRLFYLPTSVEGEA